MVDWDWKAILFSFNGRINRAKFWLVPILANLVIAGVAMILAILVPPGERGAEDAAFWVVFVPVVALTIANFWITAAVVVKRLHDRAKTGWWLLIFYLAPVVGVLLAGVFPALGWVPFLVIVAFVIWGTVELGFLKGTTGPNKYGPDPLADPRQATSAPPAL
jgi:uncharacterized membrane protein YhaH (DUF805 family)